MGAQWKPNLELIGASCERGKSMRMGVGPPPEKMKIYVSENAFQAILKPIFPYSITTILSKVRHSNTLFLAKTFAFPCHQVWVSPPPPPPPPPPSPITITTILSKVRHSNTLFLAKTFAFPCHQVWGSPPPPPITITTILSKVMRDSSQNLGNMRLSSRIYPIQRTLIRCGPSSRVKYMNLWRNISP